MGVSPSAPATAPRRIARRQGLIFGGILGIVAVIINACVVITPLSRYSFAPGNFLSSTNVFTYLLALLAFFFAGWRAAQHTGRVDIGGLAGFWAGVVAAVVVVLIDVVLMLTSLSEYSYSISGGSLAILIFNVVFVAGRDAVLALLLGAGLGALGGFIGRTSAGVLAAPAQPGSPSAPSPASSQPAQTPQPPVSPQNQP
ncbi:MAG TPA: hypothetical protein VFU32_06510 [Ktedonobacterales bacterium]|nr:hypothetical protein [Ktedonobacterales bacterium]